MRWTMGWTLWVRIWSRMRGTATGQCLKSSRQMFLKLLRKMLSSWTSMARKMELISPKMQLTLSLRLRLNSLFLTVLPTHLMIRCTSLLERLSWRWRLASRKSTSSMCLTSEVSIRVRMDLLTTLMISSHLLPLGWFSSRSTSRYSRLRVSSLRQTFLVGQGSASSFWNSFRKENMLMIWISPFRKGPVLLYSIFRYCSTFPCVSDGPLFISASRPRMWSEFCLKISVQRWISSGSIWITCSGPPSSLSRALGSSSFRAEVLGLVSRKPETVRCWWWNLFWRKAMKPSFLWTADTLASCTRFSARLRSQQFMRMWSISWMVSWLGVPRKLIQNWRVSFCMSALMVNSRFRISAISWCRPCWKRWMMLMKVRMRTMMSVSVMRQFTARISFEANLSKHSTISLASSRLRQQMNLKKMSEQSASQPNSRELRSRTFCGVRQNMLQSELRGSPKLLIMLASFRIWLEVISRFHFSSSQYFSLSSLTRKFLPELDCEQLFLLRQRLYRSRQWLYPSTFATFTLATSRSSTASPEISTIWLNSESRACFSFISMLLVHRICRKGFMKVVRSAYFTNSYPFSTMNSTRASRLAQLQISPCIVRNMQVGVVTTSSLNSRRTYGLLFRFEQARFTTVLRVFCRTRMPFAIISDSRRQQTPTVSWFDSESRHLTMLKNLATWSSFHPLEATSSDSLTIRGIPCHMEIACSAASFFTESIGLDILVIRLFCSSSEKVLRVSVEGCWCDGPVWNLVFEASGFVARMSSSASVVNRLVWMNYCSSCLFFFQSCFSRYSTSPASATPPLTYFLAICTISFRIAADDSRTELRLICPINCLTSFDKNLLAKTLQAVVRICSDDDAISSRQDKLRHRRPSPPRRS